MSTTVRAVEWKPQETTGDRSQLSMRLLADVPPPAEPKELRLLPLKVVQGWSFSENLQHAVLQSGMGQDSLARLVFMSKGYMSKFLTNVGEQWAMRLVRFMKETGSLAPLQAMADAVGCDVSVRQVWVSEADRLRAEVESLRRQLGAAA